MKQAVIERQDYADVIKAQLLRGLTCAEIAIREENSCNGAQHRGDARLAYDTALRMLLEARVSRPDAAEIETGLLELRAKLTHLGENLGFATDARQSTNSGRSWEYGLGGTNLEGPE